MPRIGLYNETFEAFRNKFNGEWCQAAPEGITYDLTIQETTAIVILMDMKTRNEMIEYMTNIMEIPTALAELYYEELKSFFRED